MPNSLGRAQRAPLVRFAERIALTDDGCIEWIAGLNGVGYGPYAGKNLYTHPIKNQRFCRECGRLAALRKRQTQKAS